MRSQLIAKGGGGNDDDEEEGNADDDDDGDSPGTLRGEAATAAELKLSHTSIM